MSCLHLKFHKAQKTVFGLNSFSAFFNSKTEVKHKQDSSVNHKEKSRCLQAAINQLISLLPERIKQLTQENGLLRQEIAFYQNIWNAVMSVSEETESVVIKLQHILASFNKVQTEAEMDCLNFEKTMDT
jgi:CRISPR/Cas system CMR-associated protein Cmr5 small subunit